MPIKKIEYNRFKDTYTPFQDFNMKYAKGDIFKLIFNAILDYSNIEDDKEYEYIPDIPLEQNISNPITLKLIEFLIKIKNPKEFLEIGTFVGVSTVCFKNVLSESSRLTYIEMRKESYDATSNNLKTHAFNNNLDGIYADASVALKMLSKRNIKYDMIYLDGGKENYHKYMKYINKIIAKEGVFIVDDIFFHGDSLNRFPVTEKGSGTKKFLEMVKKDKSYRKIILPISNGIMLLIKE